MTTKTACTTVPGGIENCTSRNWRLEPKQSQNITNKEASVTTRSASMVQTSSHPQIIAMRVADVTLFMMVLTQAPPRSIALELAFGDISFINRLILILSVGTMMLGKTGTRSW